MVNNQDAWTQTIWELATKGGLSALKVDAIIEKHPYDAPILYQKFNTTQDILIYLWSKIDDESQKNHDKSLTEQEALFDNIMGYFDVLNLYKNAVKRLSNDLLCAPMITLSLQNYGVEWAGKILTNANIENTGLIGLAKRTGFLVFFIWIFFKWLKDDTIDQSQTMADLDQGLSKMKSWYDWTQNPTWMM